MTQNERKLIAKDAQKYGVKISFVTTNYMKGVEILGRKVFDFEDALKEIELMEHRFKFASMER